MTDNRLEDRTEVQMRMMMQRYDVSGDITDACLSLLAPIRGTQKHRYMNLAYLCAASYLLVIEKMSIYDESVKRVADLFFPDDEERGRRTLIRYCYCILYELRREDK